MMFCVKLLSELMIMFSTHHLTNHLTCRNKLQFDLKNMKMQYHFEYNAKFEVEKNHGNILSNVFFNNYSRLNSSVSNCEPKVKR